MKKWLAIIVASILLFTTAGCSNGDHTQNPQNSNAKTDTLVVGCNEMAGVFSPAYYSSAYDGYVVDLVFDGLIKRNYEGDLVPSIAEDWEMVDNGKSIVFQLRDDVKFSDGTPLTAKDVEFTYLVLADPSYTGRYGSMVKDMEGYEDYFFGKTDKFAGIETSGDHQVTFHFKEALRTNLENCTLGILPQHYYGADFKVGDTSGVEALSSKPMGAGAYQLGNFSPKEFASLTKNAHYFKSGYEIKNIVCKFVNTSTEVTELTNGSVDLLPKLIEKKKILDLRNNNSISLNSYTRNGYGYIGFNCESGPTADPRVRQALAYSFHIDEYLKNDHTDPATGEVFAISQFYPYSQICWVVDDAFREEMGSYPFDLAKAESILEEAGWKKNASGIREKNGQVLELKIAAMPDNPVLSTLIPMWERDWGAIGIKLNIAYMEFNTLSDYIEVHSDENVNKWSMFFMASEFLGPDPHEIYSTYHSSNIGSGKSNFARYNNAEVDRLLDEGKRKFSENDAKPIYTEIGKILTQELPVLPIYASTYFDAYNKKLTNFKTNSLYNWVDALENAKIQ
jgi:peptide/nickel transport system substrate-binding protein